MSKRPFFKSLGEVVGLIVGFNTDRETSFVKVRWHFVFAVAATVVTYFVYSWGHDGGDFAILAVLLWGFAGMGWMSLHRRRRQRLERAARQRVCASCQGLIDDNVRRCPTCGASPRSASPV